MFKTVDFLFFIVFIALQHSVNCQVNKNRAVGPCINGGECPPGNTCIDEECYPESMEVLARRFLRRRSVEAPNVAASNTTTYDSTTITATTSSSKPAVKDAAPVEDTAQKLTKPQTDVSSSVAAAVEQIPAVETKETVLVSSTTVSAPHAGDEKSTESIGTCVNGLCPIDYKCIDNTCYKLKTEGKTPVGPCINKKCPESYICHAADEKCYS